MKMSNNGAYLESVAHNVDKNIPDDTPTCREHQGEIPHEDRAAFTWFMSHSGF